MSYSPSYELLKNKRLNFREKLPDNVSNSTYVDTLAKNPDDRHHLVYVSYAKLGSYVELNEAQVRSIFTHILDTVLKLTARSETQIKFNMQVGSLRF